MNEEFLVYSVSGLALAMFFLAFSRIAELAFIRIPSNFSEETSSPSPADIRTAQFLEKPAPILVSLTLLRLLLIVAVVCLSFATFLVFVDTPLIYNMILSFVASLLLIWISGELVPAVFEKCDPVRAFKASFFFIVPISSFLSVFKFMMPAAYSRYEKRIPRKDVISMSDISEALEDSEVEEEEIMEKKLIKGVISFGDLEVKEIMRSRVDVVALSSHSTFGDVMAQIIEAGYSRYPVFDSNLDEIKGILYLKDILPAAATGDKDYSWANQIRPAFFVPENLDISQLLHDFQTRKIHLAIVVDEYGGTSGIVTLEDILEEIVGEINDEHDTESDLILARKINDNEFVFDAKIPLHDFIRTTASDDHVFEEFEGEVETLGGIILSIIGNFPVIDQTVSYANMTFTIISMDNHRIEQVQVKIHENDQNND